MMQAARDRGVDVSDLIMRDGYSMSCLPIIMLDWKRGSLGTGGMNALDNPDAPDLIMEASFIKTK